MIDGLPGLPGVGGGTGRVETPRLAPGAALLAHARNRWLHAGLGMWTSNDPHASGQVVVDLAVLHGRSASVQTELFDLGRLYTDGGNLSASYRARPYEFADALGLTAFGFFAGLVPTPSDMVKGALKGMVEGYASNLDADVEWAMDWSQGDDWHSRTDNSWIPIAMLIGVAGEFPIDLQEVAHGIAAMPGTLAGVFQPQNNNLRAAKHSGDMYIRMRGLQVHRRYEQTSFGIRQFDGERPVSQGKFRIGFEHKTGRVRLTNEIRRQINADRELMHTGKYPRIVWILLPSLPGKPAVLTLA